MKSYLVIPFCVFALAITPACDNDKEHYSGLSELVAERNEARRTISKKSQRNKTSAGQSGVQDENRIDAGDITGKTPATDEMAGGILYEKRIEIVDSQSGMPLAKGVAFLDKKGRIVRIKLVKD